MDPRTVYTKAAKGVMELKNKSNRLSRDLTNVLKLIDGKSSVEQILEKSDRLTQNQLYQALEKLVTDGYIKIFMSGTELGAMEELDFTISPIIGAHNKKKEKATEPPKQDNPAESDAKRKALATAKAEMANKLKAAREMRAQAEVDRKKTEAESKAKAEAEAKARSEMAAKLKAEQPREIKKPPVIEVEEIAITPLTQLSQLGVDLGAETVADTRASDDLESKLRAALEVKAIAEAEKRRQEAEAKAKAEAEAKARADMAAKMKYEFEAKQRAEAEAKARAEAERREAEERARREAEEKARREAEERAKREAAERARREVEEKARREAEERARREAEERARREAEEKARREAEERAKREAAERARREAEEKARREAEERARREAEEKARREAAERARQEAEAKARAEEKARLEGEQRAQQEEEARLRAAAKTKARDAAEAEAKNKIEAEERAQQEADARVRADTKSRVGAEAKARADAKARAEAEAETRVKAREEAEAKAAEEERKRLAAEARAKAEAEARSRAESQARAKAEAWAEQEARSRVERDATRRTEDENKARLAALAKMKKKSVNWSKTIVLSVVILLGIGAGIIQFMPFNVYIPNIEKLASDRIGEPVIIRSLHISLVPVPHLKLDGITVGKSPEIKISSAKVMIDPFSLFANIKVLQSIEFEGAVLPEEVLTKAINWSKPNTAQPIQINQVKLKAAKVEIKNIDIPSFEGTFDFTPLGELRKALIQTSDARLTASINANGPNLEIDFKANDWQPPVFKIPFVFEQLSAKAIADRNGMTINELESKVYGGIAKGSGNIKWGQIWKLEGIFEIARVDLKEAFHVFSQDISASGKLNAILSYNTQSDTLNSLFDSPRAEGSFNIQKGSIGAIDLIQALQSNRDATRGGQTQFNDFSGNFSLSDSRYQFKQLKMSSGLMNATGNIEISSDRDISGRIVAQLRTKSTFTLSGPVKNPVLQRR